MIDLRKRFEAADHIGAPDLWPTVQRKVAAPADARAPRLRAMGGMGAVPNRKRAALRRVMTIAAALLIAVAAIGLVVRAFRAPPVIPAIRPPTGIFAPVQGWIAFLDGSQHLQAADPTGTRPLIQLPAGLPPIAWSLDGTRLLLGDGSMLNADGTVTRVLPPKPGVQGGSFSPDGSEIVYSDFDGSLYVIDARAHAEPSLLAAGGGDVWLAFPVWSPDGSHIAYISHRNSTRGWTISIMRKDGTGQRVLLDLSGRGIGELAPVVWSPDGSVLAFSSNPGCCNTNRSAVGIVGTDGSRFRMITPPDGSWYPSWSPDGRSIAFIRDGHIFTMTPEGGGVHRVEHTDGAQFRIAWNPVPPDAGLAQGGS